MHVLSFVMAATTGLSSFVLVSALWGYGSSWLAEIVKQHHWPRLLNTLVADLMLVGSAALATLTDATFTWKNFWSALLAASVAALVNHQFVLKPTGVGDWLQQKTSILPGG